MRSRRLSWVLVLVVLALTGCTSDDTPDGPTTATSTTVTTTTSAPTTSETDDTVEESPADDVDPESGLVWVAASELPPEARDTLTLIDAGGPYPYDQDDGVFQNREGILPDRAEGYYREYTVETPGSDDRGARRIVAGDGGELYWTDDHYASFARIER